MQNTTEAADTEATAATRGHDSANSGRNEGEQLRAWPVAVMALPAFVAIWSGWVGLGGLTGFGKVNPLPGTPLAGWTLDTAITLPIGMEVYAAFALRVWLTGHHLDRRATRFAKWSTIGSLVLGAAGQVAYHLMTAAGVTAAPWWITTVVACLPVAVLGMGAALAHLIRAAAPSVNTATLTTTGDAVDGHDGGEEAEDQADDTGEAVPAPRPAPRIAGQAPAADGRGSSGRRSGRGRSAAATAARVARLRERHPDWTVGQIAQRAGVTDRTVRRHLNGTPNTAPDAALADRPAGEEAAA